MIYAYNNPDKNVYMLLSAENEDELSKKVSKYLYYGYQLAGRPFSHIDSDTLNENYVEEENEDEAVLIAENIDIMDSPDREDAVAKMDSYIKKNDLYYTKYFQAVHKPSNY